MTFFLTQLNVDPNNKSALMSALSALLGPNKLDKAKDTVRKPSQSGRKSLALTNTTLFLVDKNENFEWRANIAALDDVFVDPSRPPVKGENVTYTPMFAITSYVRFPISIFPCLEFLS